MNVGERVALPQVALGGTNRGPERLDLVASGMAALSAQLVKLAIHGSRRRATLQLHGFAVHLINRARSPGLSPPYEAAFNPPRPVVFLFSLASGIIGSVVDLPTSLVHIFYFSIYSPSDTIMPFCCHPV